MKNYFFLLLTAFAFHSSFSVSNKESKREGHPKINHKEVEASKIITVDFSTCKQTCELTDYFDVEFVLLENTPLSMIGEIKKVVVTNSYVYVLDERVAQQLFQFDRKGKFIRSFGQRGRGPGEYTELADFNILESKKEVRLYADDDRKIMVFNPEGELKKELIISDFGGAIHHFSDGSFLNMGWGSLYNCTFWNNKGQKIQSYKDTSVDYIKWKNSKSISSRKDTCFISFPFNNNIYQATKNKMEIAYRIDFLDKNFPILEKDNFEKNSFTGNYGQIEAISHGKDVLTMTALEGRGVRYLYYFKNNNKILISKFTLVHGIPMYQLIGDYENGSIYSVSPMTALNYFKEKEKISKEYVRPSELKYITSNSNPFIAILKYIES